MNSTTARHELISGAPGSSSEAGRRGVQSSLRTQFTLVIFLLAFLPNLVLTVTAKPGLPAVTTVAWMLLVAAICGAVGYYLSGALLAPLSRLEAEVQQGNFAEPHADDPGEIRALRGAFTGLLGRLSTEQARRNAFMATLVHDLKTPLIATGHLTQALTTLPLPDAERREVGQQIQSETSRLLGLVQQMADAHRFEREDVRLQTSPTDLRELLDNVARRLMPQAIARGLSLTVSGNGNAEVDAGTLERAVNNLTENALRYATSQIHLAVTLAGLAVQDDGPGLSAPLHDLAQPFNAQPTTIAGQQFTTGTAGLGLFIARRIAEAHGGSLNYQRLAAHSPLLSVQPDAFSPAPPSQGVPSFTLFTLALPEVNLT